MTTTIEKRISAVRKVLKKARLEALLVPTGDPHMSEYLPENWAFRRWLTGFTGSAGTLVVTAEKALLWTDSRYWEQAAKETEATGITVMKGFAGGRLFDEKRCPFGVPIAERMQKTAELFGR